MPTKTALINKINQVWLRLINILFRQGFLGLLVKLVQELTRDHCECTMTLFIFHDI